MQLIKNLIIIIVAFFTISEMSLYACEMNFEVLKGKKASYTKNDELVVKLTVEFTHRNCPEGIKSTELNPSGLDIIAATNWTEKSPGTWERKLNIKITNPKSGKATLNAVRECKKDGGSATLTLKAK